MKFFKQFFCDHKFKIKVELLRKPDPNLEWYVPQRYAVCEKCEKKFEVTEKSDG